MGRGRKRKVDSVNDRTLYVRGFPPDTEKSVLMNYFSEFGELENVDVPEKLGGRVAFVVYKQLSSCENILKLGQNHQIGDSNIYVNPVQKSSLKLTLTEHVFQDAIDKIEKTCKTVGEQIYLFTNCLSLTDKDANTREVIRQEIFHILHAYYPHCRVYLFGSSINNFGNRGSDVDLLLEPYPGYFEYKSSNDESSDYDTPLCYHLSREEILFHIHLLFKKNRLGLSCSQFIEAKCSIVNFCHNRSSLSCDLSCSNMLSVYNSELLNFYSRLDKRVVPLVIIIRNWGKQHNFAVKGSFTSYAVSWLVIFYLQNTDPPILPPVQEVMSRADYSRPVAGFETAYCDDIWQFAPSSNDKPIEMLLYDFFLFYLNFDFSLVISPRTGTGLSRDQCPELENTRRKTFICMEDPFELTRNITGNVSPKKFLCFFSSLKLATKTYDPYEEASVTSWGISNLFCNTNHMESITLQDDSDVRFATNQNRKKCSTFLVIVNEKILRSVVGSTKPKMQQNNWFETVISALLYIFNHALLFDASVVDFIIKSVNSTMKLAKTVKDKIDDSNCKSNGDVNKTVEKCQKLSNASSPEHCVEKRKRKMDEPSCSYDNDSEETFDKSNDFYCPSTPSTSLQDLSGISLNDEAVENSPSKCDNSKKKKPLIDDISHLIVKLEVLVTKDTWTKRFNSRPSSHAKQSALLEDDHKISLSLQDRHLDGNIHYFTCSCYFYNKRQLGFKLFCDDDKLTQLQLLPFLQCFLTLKMGELFSEDLQTIKSYFLHNEIF